MIVLITRLVATDARAVAGPARHVSSVIQTRRKILFRYRWSKNSHSSASVPIGTTTGPNEPECLTTPPRKKRAMSSNGMIRAAMYMVIALTPMTTKKNAQARNLSTSMIV